MVKQILLATDQLLNTLFGGYADETISARAYRRGWKFRQLFINSLFFDRNHCRDSFRSELNRTQLPPEYNQHG